LKINAYERCHRIGHDVRNCRENGPTGKLVVRAPLAARVAHELGCGADGEVVVFKSRQENALTYGDLMRSCKNDESMGTIEIDDMGYSKIYEISP
jgi:hypothetical protein